MMEPRTVTLLELFRVAPAKSSVLTLVPLTLAVAQLANGLFNGVPIPVAIGFAAGMVAFAVVATGHHRAEYRRRTLESFL